MLECLIQRSTTDVFKICQLCPNCFVFSGCKQGDGLGSILICLIRFNEVTEIYISGVWTYMFLEESRLQEQ